MRNLIQLFSVLLNWSKGVQRSRAMLVMAMMAGAIAGLASTALIAVINAALAGASPVRLLRWEFIALCFLIPAAGFGCQVLLVRLTARAANNMRLQLSRQILSTPYRRVEELSTHRILAAITEDIPAVTAAITSMPLLGIQFAVMIGCLTYLGWLSWPILLLLLGYLVLGLFSYRLPMRKAGRYFWLMREEWDAFLKGIRGLTEGLKELKLNRARRSAFLSQQLQPSVDKLQLFGIRANTLSLVASNWGQIQYFVFIGLVLFATPLLITVDRQTLTGYTLTVLFMMAPLGIILSTMPTFGRAYASAEKIKRLGLSLTNDSAETVITSSADPAPDWLRLDLLGVTHTYHDEAGAETFYLGPLDLTFRTGELVFLIGGNGSGKTTLVKLLAGLYEPEKGQILLDGKAIEDDTRDNYRQLFSAVFSDFYLFERLFGLNPDGLEAKGREYLVQLELNHKVEIDHDKLSTTDLSQGQRKRLALLTAYLEDRPIYIFDEWASDQDPMFRQVFYYRILPDLKARGKTVFVISHDDRYYGLADRIVKLERGHVVEYEKALTHSSPASSSISASLA